MLMRCCAAAFTLCLVTLSSAACAESRARATVPSQIIAQISRDTMLPETVDTARDSLSTYLVAVPLELNRDDTPELIVRGTRMMCGATGNCPVWIFRRSEGGFERLLYATTVQTIVAQSTVTRGYRDVLTSGHGSATESEYTLYQFDGRVYRAIRCWVSSYRYVDSLGEAHDLEQPRITPAACDSD